MRDPEFNKYTPPVSADHRYTIVGVAEHEHAIRSLRETRANPILADDLTAQLRTHSATLRTNPAAHEPISSFSGAYAAKAQLDILFSQIVYFNYKPTAS